MRSWIVSNLCHTYYQHDYQPEKVAAFLVNRARTSSTPVLADFEGLYALMFLNANFGLGLDLEHYKTYRIPETGDLSVAGVPPWIVLGQDSGSVILVSLGKRKVTYLLQFNSGFFKVYSPTLGRY